MLDRTAFRMQITRLLLIALVGAIVLVPALTSMAGNFGTQRAVGGIVVDPNGVVRQVTVAEQVEWITRVRQDMEGVAQELNLPVELRKVSLRSLEAAIAEAQASGQTQLPDEVRYLAGLQRIQFVLVYPEQNDIVLAGPGEGWKLDDKGNLVGVTTGKPVLHLDDLLIAFRTAEAARTEGISVSIDPTPEGVRRFEQFMKRQKTFNRSVVAGLAEAIGPQAITFTGVPADSHFARVLLAADHRMKLLAMNLQKSPVANLPGFLEILKQKRRLPSNAMPRWWMACNYEPLACSEDKLAWELRGPGVKAMTEDELIAADGTFEGTGRADPIAKQWADGMTDRYEALAEKDVIFAELRNVMDMCVVAALIKKEDLTGLAGVNGFPLLAGEQGRLTPEKGKTPETLSTKCSYLKIGRNYVITASGGVQIESWEVASKTKVDAEVKQIHSKAAAPADSAWWWN